MRKLDILVPHWQETREEMEPLLDSIMTQQGVDMDDVGVIIAYDGPDASRLPEDEWTKRYPFVIEFVHASKGGVSHARNAALDASSSKYVMFSDADDMFCDVCGLYILFREIDGDGFDTLMSCFREETRVDGATVFINHNVDSTFVHGKVHRREYLTENGIRFNDDLTVHEDSYFNILCQNLCDKDRFKICQTPFFLWKWRDASVCRHDPKYLLKTFVNMLDSNDALVDEFTRRMRSDLANQFCVMMVYDSFYTMCTQKWLDTNNEEYRNKAERRFAEYFRKHRTKWESVDDGKKMQISDPIRHRHIMEGDMLREPITVDQWIETVLKKY